MKSIIAVFQSILKLNNKVESKPRKAKPVKRNPQGMAKIWKFFTPATLRKLGGMVELAGYIVKLLFIILGLPKS